MRALVLGAGPAGLLTALTLARRGYAVHLADPSPGDGARTRPQSAHVHSYPASAWERLTTWLPELPTITGRHPERPRLDAALWALCRPYLAVTHAARLSALSFRAGGAQVRLSARDLSFELVVDASGLARATIAGVASSCNAPVPIDEGPPGAGYLSLRLGGVVRSDTRPMLACRHSDTGAGAILLTRPDASACLTLQIPREASTPADLETVLAFLARLPDSRLLQSCSGARMQGPPRRFPGRPASRLALDAMMNLPDPWIPVGDCLLSTQPFLGHGIDQLTEQVDLLAGGVDARLRWPEIRATLVARARERWWAATWIDALQEAVAGTTPKSR